MSPRQTARAVQINRSAAEAHLTEALSDWQAATGLPRQRARNTLRWCIRQHRAALSAHRAPMLARGLAYVAAASVRRAA